MAIRIAAFEHRGGWYWTTGGRIFGPYEQFCAALVSGCRLREIGPLGANPPPLVVAYRQRLALQARRAMVEPIRASLIAKDDDVEMIF